MTVTKKSENFGKKWYCPPSGMCQAFLCQLYQKSTQLHRQETQ